MALQQPFLLAIGGKPDNFHDIQIKKIADRTPG
jgi:hypothetical protein